MQGENHKQPDSIGDSVTPEERLLKIIETPNVTKRDANAFKTKIFPEVAKTSRKIFSIIKGFRLNKIHKSSLKHFRLRTLNFGVAFVCASFTVYSVIDFIKSTTSLDKRIKNIEAPSAESKIIQPQKLNIDVGQLAESAKTRNVFSFLPPRMETSTSSANPAAATAIKLVGILWSANPQVMIEDTAEQKTYFLSTGENLKNITVKKIFKDKVILNRDGQEFELR
jgi:type II secretory pathway component PulC